MNVVRIDISPSGNDMLKVVWNDEQPWPSYCVNRRAVEKGAELIRKILNEIVDVCLKGGLKRSGILIKELAKAGAKLHTALFTQYGGSEIDPTQIQNFYRNKAVRLRFSVAGGIHIPWGLVYSLDPSLLPDDPLNITWETYKSFWCLDHDAVATYQRIPPNAIADTLSQESARLLLVAHREAFEKALASLTQDDEKSFLGSLFANFIDPIYDSGELDKYWKVHGSQTALLCFYCHATGSKLAFSDIDAIDTGDLFLALSPAGRPAGQTGCLVVINGCYTAVGDSDGGFLESTSHQGMCGFVGTEAPIPDLFALRFSLALLHCLVHDGLTVSEAMNKLYRAHFPLSLLYSIYAHPGFRLPKIVGLSGLQTKGNLSLDERQIGTGDLL